MHEEIRQLQEDMGWDEDSMICLFMSFIEEHGLTEECLAWLRQAARDEEDMFDA